MGISIDKALGIYPHTLALRAKRAEVLANNIANAETPGYKARDIDFQKMLNSLTNEGNGQVAMRATQAGHQTQLMDTSASPELLYRMPSQPSIDGNTVDGDQEKSEFMRNSMRYQSSFNFLNGSIKGVLKALRGE